MIEENKIELTKIEIYYQHKLLTGCQMRQIAKNMIHWIFRIRVYQANFIKLLRKRLKTLLTTSGSASLLRAKLTLIISMAFCPWGTLQKKNVLTNVLV